MSKCAFVLIAIGLLILTGLSGRHAAAGSDDETLRLRTDQLVQPYLDNDIVVGMTIGVLREGKQGIFGYGRMSRDDSRVPDGDTIYEIGSATKVLTGILLADAVVRGQVKLDQPAGNLLPAGVKMPASGDRAITLQDLSTHVSGLPRLPDNMKVGDPNNPYADYLAEDLYAFLNHHELRLDPGTEYKYSNVAQGLLGHLLSLRAKSTYEDLLRSRIALPLKMSSTTVTVDTASQSRFAPGHRGDGQPAANWDIPVLAGAGGVRSTVNDMLLFAAVSLDPPKDKLGEAIEMAWTVHQKPIEEGEASLGLGWHVKPDGTHWHNGQTGGYHAMILINRESKSSVILLTNTAAGEVDELATDILRMISGEKVAPRNPEKVSLAKMLQEHLGQFAAAAKQKSPFAAVRWRDSHPQVKIGDEWFKLVSLDGIPAADIVAFSRRTYGNRWRMRFEEDLTDVLTGMGHEPKDTVQLIVMPLDSTATRTLEDVPMTRANRQAISDAADGTGKALSDRMKAFEAAHFPAAAKQRSPFAAVRWQQSKPEVKVGEEWFKLESLDGLSAADILAFSQRTYGDKWKMRFEEDLVDVLTGMGHEPKDTVQLVVMPLESTTARTLEDVPMTRANRQAIKAAADGWGIKRLAAHFSQGGEQEQPTRPAAALDVPAEALQKLVGNYELAPGLLVTVEAVDGKLMIRLAGQPSQQVFARSETVWFYKDADVTFTFKVDKNGKCDSLVMSQKQTFKRKDAAPAKGQQGKPEVGDTSED